MNRVIFRADASAEIGGGHVMRCLTLAGQLAAYGWDCSFETNEDSLETVPLLTRSQFHVETVEERWGEQCNLLVVDHYGLDRSYETRQRERAGRILTLDDAPGRQHDCDILLDQTYQRDITEYKGFIPSHATVLAGTDYALLRPQFARLRPQAMLRRASSKRVDRIFISFGASDPYALTALAVGVIASLGLDVRIDVAAGNAKAEDLGIDLDKIEKASRIHIHGFEADTAELMMYADLAIGAAGSTAWERCCLGLPTIMLIVADNQQHIAQALHEAGAALSLGHAGDIHRNDLADAINDLTLDHDLRLQMTYGAAATCDGAGTGRVVAEILNHCDDIGVRAGH